MYQNILVPVDGSTTSDRGLDEAIRLARLTRGHLRLIHVVDELSLALSTGIYTGGWLDALRAGGAKILDTAKAKVQAAGIPVDSVLQDDLSFPVDQRVVAEARDWPADVIVLGTHGRHGVMRWAIGSDAERIARASPVPVLLVRAPGSILPDMPSAKPEHAAA